MSYRYMSYIVGFYVCVSYFYFFKDLFFNVDHLKILFFFI